MCVRSTVELSEKPQIEASLPRIPQKILRPVLLEHGRVAPVQFERPNAASRVRHPDIDVALLCRQIEVDETTPKSVRLPGAKGNPRRHPDDAGNLRRTAQP